ncbi:hypothetical protein AB4144_04015 [Rhizobiaceae sp. 2RAB30]
MIETKVSLKERVCFRQTGAGHAVDALPERSDSVTVLIGGYRAQWAIALDALGATGGG